MDVEGKIRTRRVFLMGIVVGFRSGNASPAAAIDSTSEDMHDLDDIMDESFFDGLNWVLIVNHDCDSRYSQDSFNKFKGTP